jgi:hypothetical protein
MTARIKSDFTPSCCELCSTNLSNASAGSGSQGGRLNGTGDTTHGTVKNEAAGVGVLPETAATCFKTEARCEVKESAMLDWAWGGFCAAAARRRSGHIQP